MLPLPCGDKRECLRGNTQRAGVLRFTSPPAHSLIHQIIEEETAVSQPFGTAGALVKHSVAASAASQVVTLGLEGHLASLDLV
jgi:hypothetical protein